MKPDLSKIKNIIFDLGNVLLDLNFEATVESFIRLGLNPEIIKSQNIYADPVFYRLETGKISPEVFRSRIRQLINNPQVKNRQIDDAWNAMLGDFPKNRVRMLQRLADNHQIFLFSNTNAIHINRMHKEFRKKYRFDFSSLFKQNFYSHEIGERKPDRTSFQKVIQLAGINPQETLFVDDLEVNIAGARPMGLETLWLQKGMEITTLLE
jgi:glucose-1-phosphatase